MTHLHLPDGALPLWLWLPGFLLCLALLVFINHESRESAGERLALLGSLSALQLASMALPLGPLGYHLSLAPVVGILLGPGLAFVAAVVVNSMLALLGHGGLTTLGLNSLILGATAAVAAGAFAVAARRLRAFWAGALAATAAQLVSLVLFLAVVGLSGLHPGPAGAGHAGHAEHEGLARLATQQMWSELGRFALLSLPFWIPGLIAESLVTGAVTRFLRRVSPGLLPAAVRAEGSAG